MGNKGSISLQNDGEVNWVGDKLLLKDIHLLIEKSRQTIASFVNAELTMLYWHVGRRIKQEIMHHKRAEYGKLILHTLSAKLTVKYGRGWSERNLAYMIQFAGTFPEEEILQTLCAKLSWSHFKDIIYIDDPLKREFYAEMCRIESWSVRTLRKRIDGMLYERTALSRKPDELISHELQQLRQGDRLSPDLVFKDPTFSIFLA